MKVRLLSGRVWLVVIAIAAAYTALGFGYSTSNRVEGDLFGAAHIAVLAVAVAFIGIYTALGLLTPAAKWWRNELGTALVLAFAGTIPSSAVFVYIAYFHHFQLDQALPDWIYSSGPLLSTAGLIWLSWVWLKQARASR